MASVLPGYEYDIFLSYRHKDNRYDGWVTEFVSNLRKELEATFKDEISIYFDENPHDGLLDTHIVNDSLSKKLKCLIFIPVISHTYCDEKSFAWRNEFLVFTEKASQDAYGLKVQLPNGNVGSRILPVKIHEINAGDQKLLASHTDGVLRSVDFIFKTAGVNRPLHPKDDRRENLNRSFYRDQINKVANSVRELIEGMATPGLNTRVARTEEPASVKNPARQDPSRIRRLMISGFRIFPAGTETDFLAFSLPEAIAGSLSDLKGISIQLDLAGTMNSLSQIDIENIAFERKLDAAISGSILKVGEDVRVTITLVELPSLKLLWTKTTQKKIENLFTLHDDMIRSILSSLKISLDSKEESLIDNSISKDASVYPLFLKANQLSLEVNEWEKARDIYLDCLGRDPDFVPALARIARCYRLIGKYAASVEENERNLAFAESTFQHALRLKPDSDHAHGLMAQLEVDQGKPLAGMKRLLSRIGQGGSGAYLFAGLVPCLRWVGLLEESLEADKIAREIDPSIITSVGQTYWMLGQYEIASTFLTGDIGYLEGVSHAALGNTGYAIQVLYHNEQKTERDTLKCYLRSLRFALQGNKEDSVKNLRAAQTPGMDGEALFYLSRIYAYLGLSREAVELVKEFIRKGFFPVRVFKKDPWLMLLNQNADFQTLMDQATNLQMEASEIYSRLLPHGLESRLVSLRTIQV